MAIALSTVTDSISQLDVAGVKILDIDEINAEIQERDCPVLLPEVANFMGDVVVERDSSGDPSIALKRITYTLNYVFLYTRAGATRLAELEKYGDMCEKVGLILDAIIANDDITGAVDMWPVAVTEFGPVPDPAGNNFLGCRIQVQILEFIN